MTPKPSIAMLVYNACTADPRVRKEAQTLASAGHRVRVIALLEGDLPRTEQAHGFEIVRIERNPLHYRLWEKLRRLRSTGRMPKGGRSRGADAARPAEADDSPLVVSTYRAGRRVMRAVHRPLMMLDYYQRAFRLLRADRPAVLHAHDLLTLPVGAAFKRATGTALVYDAHELYPEVSTLSNRERRAWGWIERQLIGRADALITVCDSIADELARRYAVERPKVLLNCPDGDRGKRAVGRDELAGIDVAGPLILYTGGFVEHRGLETLVRSARELDQGTIVLLGSGRLEMRLRRLIASEGLEHRVVIRPPVPPEQVLAYTAAADVGVIPYEPVGLNNRFTTPNKLFDYMGAGVPIVASRLPELERFVAEPARGLLFEPGNPGDLASALNRIAADDDLRAKMARESLEAGRTFTWKRQSGVLLETYSGLLAGPA